MNLKPRLARPDVYLADAAYDRLADELAAPKALDGDPPHICPQTWAVEFLGCLPGVWPQSCQEVS